VPRPTWGSLRVLVHRPVPGFLHTGRVKQDLRARAITLLDAELERLRAIGVAGVRPLAGGSPHDRESHGVTVSTRVEAENGRLLVLVEVWRGRRTLATGGFAMEPDGSTHTPH
jgi:hypothetical protein